jgi:hypothetical protein
MLNSLQIQMASLRLRPTLGNSQWMQLNKEKVLAVFPVDWSSANKIQLPLGFAFKVLGVEWKETSDLIIAFMWLEKLGLVESQSSSNDPSSLVVRRKPINQ